MKSSRKKVEIYGRAKSPRPIKCLNENSSPSNLATAAGCLTNSLQS